MRILFVTPDFYPRSTGFANASLNLIDSILYYGSDKYLVYVFTYTQLDGNQEIQNGVKITRYHKRKSIKLMKLFHEKKEYKEFKKLIDDNYIDIIFFETNTFPLLQYWTLKDYKNKVFVRIHSTADTEVPIFNKHKSIGDKIAFILTKKFMYGVRNVISTSTFYIDFVKKYYYDNNVFLIWNDKSYGVIHNTSNVDFEVIQYEQNNNTFITMGKLSDNGFIQKGISDLLKAIYYIKSFDKLVDGFRLIIIGDGRRLLSIENMIKDFELSDNVELIKSAPHNSTLNLILSAKAVVLLSRYDGQSMFITESLSLGKPIIISDNNGMQDMIHDGKNGIIVKTGDPISAANAIIKIMEMDPVDINEMGHYSKNLYDEKFSGKAIYRQFDNAMILRTK